MRQNHRKPVLPVTIVLAAVLVAACNSAGAAGPPSASTRAAGARYATTVTSSGPVNPAAIPLGDGYRSTTPKMGHVDSCITNFPSKGGATVVGPWINETKKTWDSLTKIAVSGSVSWPQARFSVTVSGKPPDHHRQRPAGRPHHRYLPHQHI